MKKQLLFFLSCITFSALGQVQVEVLPNGNINPNPIEGLLPEMTNEKFIETTQLWAQRFSRGEVDFTEVTENSVTIDAFRDNAFFYRNVGETFYFRIKYQMKITKKENLFSIYFKITEIHTNKIILTSTIADYFTSDGKLKEGFEEVKPSLENTLNKIINSYIVSIRR